MRSFVGNESCEFLYTCSEDRRSLASISESRQLVINLWSSFMKKIALVDAADVDRLAKDEAVFQAALAVFLLSVTQQTKTTRCCHQSFFIS